jgi:hypothetical protein
VHRPTCLYFRQLNENLDSSNPADAGRYQSTFDTPLDYAFQTTPQPSSGGSTQAKTIRAGKMLGGSTGINGLAWSKPHTFQLDGLEAVGNAGVNWDSLQGYVSGPVSLRAYPLFPG